MGVGEDKLIDSGRQEEFTQGSFSNFNVIEAGYPLRLGVWTWTELEIWGGGKSLEEWNRN